MNRKKVGYLSIETDRGPDKTTFGYLAAEQYFFGQKDEAGALWKALGNFSGIESPRDVYRLKETTPNLLCVYPLPIIGRPWEYNMSRYRPRLELHEAFFVDLQTS